jgi:hypothetical protein
MTASGVGSVGVERLSFFWAGLAELDREWDARAQATASVTAISTRLTTAAAVALVIISLRFHVFIHNRVVGDQHLVHRGVNALEGDSDGVFYCRGDLGFKSVGDVLFKLLHVIVKL